MPRPLREVVAMHPAALGGREFGKHARFELRSIIAGLCDFFGITLAIPLVRILDRSGGELQLLPRRNHQYVEHVADPGARQMGMAEPHDRAILLMIARTRVPAVRIGIGAQLRHPERQRRSEEHTSELQSLMRISYAVFCLKKK